MLQKIANSFLVFLSLFFFAATAFGQGRANLAADREALANGWRFDYVAARTKRPMMLVFRCVPWGDCEEFDGQVVRLEKIRDVADKFVRVRLAEIESTNLKLFEFDYDLTFMVFFLSLDEKVFQKTSIVMWKKMADFDDSGSFFH